MFGSSAFRPCVLIFFVHLNSFAIVCQNPGAPKIPPTKHAVGLDEYFKIKNCVTIGDCKFLFVCPEGHELKADICQSKHVECSPLSNLTYSIYPFDLLEILPDRTIPRVTKKTKTCKYEITELMNGKTTEVFNLTFHQIEGKLILKSQHPKDFIKCFSGNQTVQLKQSYFYQTDEENVLYYELVKMTEPNNYYCYTYISNIFKPSLTEEVLAYSKSSYNKYILKISLLHDPFQLALAEICEEINLDQCKLIKEESGVQFYFFRDKSMREIGTMIQTIKDAINALSGKDFKVDYVRSIYYCLPEIKNGVFWDQTLFNTISTSKELCLDFYGNQITRTCAGNFFDGAYWKEPTGECSENVQIPRMTLSLYQLLNQYQSIPKNLPKTSVDVDLVSRVFENIVTKPVPQSPMMPEDEFTKNVLNIMNVESKLLKNSQRLYNSTDRILGVIDAWTEDFAQHTSNLSTLLEEKFISHVTCPLVTQIIGVAIYSKHGSYNFLDYEIVNIHENQTFEDLEEENLEVAMYVPKDHLDEMTSNLSDVQRENFKIISTVFYDDALFNEQSDVRRPTGSRILNVKIPGFEQEADGLVQLLFGRTFDTNETGCVYWNYGQQKFGTWSESGGKGLHDMPSFDNSSGCSFSHLTHFALLVMSEKYFRKDDFKEVMDPMAAHDLPLTLITVVGCGLSVFGVGIILITMIVSKGWYKRRLNSIQLSIIMLLEGITLFIADLDKLQIGISCKIVAAILHYFVLAKFVWMLLIARLQYQKFVKVFETAQTDCYVVVYSLLGWIIPIIFVAISFSVFPENYEAGMLHFCYAKSDSLYFFLILPASIIILVNIIVFILIMINISRSKCKEYGTKIHKLQLRLAILLFFMLGVTWIFGIIGEFLPVLNWLKLASLYIFCILGSTQGFVMFVFNILMDPDTRAFWKNTITCKSNEKKDYLNESTRNTNELSQIKARV